MDIIQEEKYKEVLESGLLLDHYFILCNIKNGKKLVNTKRIQGFINLLTKKGYLEGENLTEAGLTLVEDCGLAELVPTATEDGNNQKVDYDTWVLALHRKCQDKLYDLTKQRQIRAKIEKKTYPFLPNATDLKKVLAKTIMLYKLKDYEKIEKTILKYITNCVSENEFFPLVQYYILKNGASQMVTDLEAPETVDTGFKSNQKLI